MPEGKAIEKVEKFVKEIGKAIAERGKINIVDVGDVEVVSFDGMVIAMPKGKEMFFVQRAKGFIPAKIKKLTKTI